MLKALNVFGCVMLGLGACQSVESKGAELPPEAFEVAQPEKPVESPTVIQIRTLGQSDDHLGSSWLKLKANGEFERIDDGFPRGERRTSGVVPVRLIQVWRGRWERLKALKPAEGPAVRAEMRCS
jgi:hypothetical protein